VNWFIYLTGKIIRSETPTSIGKNAINLGSSKGKEGENGNNNPETGVASRTNSTTNLIKGSKVSDGGGNGGANARAQRKPLESSNSVSSDKDVLLKETIKGI
jgi:hypothetical protein